MAAEKCQVLHRLVHRIRLTISLTVQLFSSVLHGVELLLLLFENLVSESHRLGAVKIAEHAVDVLLHGLAARGQHNSPVLKRVKLPDGSSVAGLVQPLVSLQRLPLAHVLEAEDVRWVVSTTSRT